MGNERRVSRRAALRTSLQALAIAGTAGVAESRAFADSPAAEKSGSTPAQRSLVCIYMAQGFDSNDAVIPFGQYSSYASGRAGLAVSRNSLIGLRSAQSSVPDYGLHPALAGLGALYQSQNLAVMAGVGQARMPAAGESDASMVFLPGGWEFPAWAARTAPMTGFPNLRGVPGSASGLVVSGAPAEAQKALYQVSESSSFSTPFPTTSLGLQLKQVASLLQVGPSLGLRQPVFTCFHAGFEGTPDGQSAFYSDLAAAMSSFYQATVELGIAGAVTTYTDTPWNRTLAPNSKGLAEAAWSGHQLILGGSVRGGQVYGEFPDLRLGSASDATGKGTWIPGASRERFTASLAAWQNGGRVPAPFAFLG
jgi:uncharacterized protein (DUF1501 family)